MSTTMTATNQTPFGSLGRLITPAQAPTAADREQCYQAALKLVERIESNLRCSRRCLYWRVSDKAQLTTVTEVVNAILSDDLLLPEDVQNAA